MLPAVNFEGKILMQSPSAIKLAPNGNGSLFDAIRQRQDVQAVIKNLAYLQIIGIDNVIGKVLDPLFIGYTCENGFQASLKTVERESETEPVGLVVSKNGITEVIEYTEVPEKILNNRQVVEKTSYWFAPPPGKFIFHQAQILVFLIDAQFLLQMVT